MKRIVKKQDKTGRRIRDLGAQGYKAQTAFLSADQQTVNIMKSNGNEQRLVTLRVGAATPAFMTHKSKENLTYLGLSSAQGKVLAFEMNGYKARALYVFNATDGRQSLKIPLPEEREIWSVKISPDGSKIFPGGSLIDAASGKTLRELPGSYASFSQDGKLIAVAWPSDEANDEANYAEVWDVASLRPIKRISVGDSQCTSLLFSADGKLLVCGTRDAGIYIWNIPTGKKVKSFEREVIANHVNTASLALSADGKLIAAGPGQRATSSGDVGRETGIFVWDVASEKLRFTLRGHEDNVYALAFTPDGRWLSSASLDGTIRYWDMKTGAAAATFASSKNGRWAMISDKGFFAGSADAGDLLSVVRGYQAFSINQL
ncbi:MAG: WD40 repeat domain-containing protein [Rhodomicrobium sp.]